MVEIKLDQLSPKSQKSQFSLLIVDEANALAKKDTSASLKSLESHARDRVAFGEYSKRLRKESDIDVLTGALSRKAILRGVRESMAEVERKGGQIQVLFM